VNQAREFLTRKTSDVVNGFGQLFSSQNCSLKPPSAAWDILFLDPLKLGNTIWS